MGVNNAATYLRGEIRLPVVERKWPEAADLPLHLARGDILSIVLFRQGWVCYGRDSVGGPPPDLKRIESLVSDRAVMSVAPVAQIDLCSARLSSFGAFRLSLFSR